MEVRAGGRDHDSTAWVVAAIFGAVLALLLPPFGAVLGLILSVIVIRRGSRPARVTAYVAAAVCGLVIVVSFLSSASPAP